LNFNAKQGPHRRLAAASKDFLRVPGLPMTALRRFFLHVTVKAKTFVL
jgi:hypothetical protein